jgi:hypothetical protein
MVFPAASVATPLPTSSVFPPARAANVVGGGGGGGEVPSSPQPTHNVVHRTTNKSEITGILFTVSYLLIWRVINGDCRLT